MLQRLTRSLDEAQRELARAPERDRNKIRNRITRLTNNIRVCADYKRHFGRRVLKYRLRRCSGLVIAGVAVSGEFTLAGELTDRNRTALARSFWIRMLTLPEVSDVKNQLRTFPRARRRRTRRHSNERIPGVARLFRADMADAAAQCFAMGECAKLVCLYCGTLGPARGGLIGWCMWWHTI